MEREILWSVGEKVEDLVILRVVGGNIKLYNYIGKWFGIIVLIENYIYYMFSDFIIGIYVSIISYMFI